MRVGVTRLECVLKNSLDNATIRPVAYVVRTAQVDRLNTPSPQQRRGSFAVTLNPLCRQPNEALPQHLQD